MDVLKEISDKKEVESDSAGIIPEEEQTVTASLLPAYTNTYSRTRVESTAFDFTWKIDEFYFIYKNLNSLRSPSFADKYQYMIEMVIKRDAEYSPIQFYLRTSTECIGSCIITIKYPFDTSLLFTGSISGRILDKTLLTEIPKSRIPTYSVNNDTFTIQCHFDIIHRQVTNVINMTASSTIFSKDVKSFENSCLDEFEFKVESIKFIVGHEQYLVPKRMLCAINSSYFKNICLKKSNKEVDMTKLLKDNEVEDFKSLLLFIITQDLKQHDYYKLKNMLKIAHKCDVLALKLMCEHYLLKDITVKNALELIQLAFLTNATLLKMRLASFIKLHKLEIMTSKEFRNLSQKDADEIMELVEKSKMFQHITQDVDSPPVYRQNDEVFYDSPFL